MWRMRQKEKRERAKRRKGALEKLVKNGIGYAYVRLPQFESFEMTRLLNPKKMNAF